MDSRELLRYPAYSGIFEIAHGYKEVVKRSTIARDRILENEMTPRALDHVRQVSRSVWQHFESCIRVRMKGQSESILARIQPAGIKELH